MIRLLSLLSLVFILACNNNTTSSSEVKTEKVAETPMTSSVEIPVVDYNGLAPIFAHKSDTTYVINFWATWCKPCVAELPYFLELHKKYEGQKYKFIFVSLDFPKQINKKLIPFLEKKPLPGDVIVLDDSDSNNWIPKVDPEWSGAIPATVVYNGDRKIFAEKSFHDFPELANWVETLK
jgi:thiol-disulfide isomerase/thioredoxin